MKLSIVQKKIEGMLAGFNGRAAYKIEASGEVIEHNSHDIFQSASTIKIPILLEGFRQSEAGKVELDRVIDVPMSAIAGGSGVLQSLSRHVKMTVKDLIVLMIIVSDNTATNMVIDLLGQENINKGIKILGLKQTVLQRRMMEFGAINEGRDNFTSAADLVACLKAIYEGEIFSNESKADILTILRQQKFFDKLPAYMDVEEVSFAGKSGGLDGVSHDCGIFKYKGQIAYAAVLTDRLPNNEEGRRLIADIGKILYEHLTCG
ncbi:serine hydrolase [Peribacillus sp. SCS-155]|uniref:serine hydrolase n=1 Tax=Peribacillus sedimenti TaxID=3115297 RepID=UPI003906C41D